jgi:iron complex outermembrane receptor protein
MGGKGTDQFSTINQPSYVTFTAAQAATVGLGPAGVYVIPNAVKTANPKKSDFVFVGTSTTAIPVSNRFDFGGVTQMQPDGEQTSGYVSLERKLNDHLTAFASVSVSQSKNYYDTAQFFYSTSLSGYTFTADNPYNPFGIPLTAGSTTPVAFTVQSGNTHELQEAYDLANSFLLGVRGKTRNTWEWESAVSYGVDRAMRSLDLVPVASMRAILAGTTRTTAFNPFGPSDNPNLLKDVLVRAPIRNNVVDAFTYDLSATGKPWQIPLRGASELGVAAGYEFREEDLRGHPDTGTYVGFTPNLPFHGRRHVNGAYLEFSLPLQKWFEFDVAGRHELYSDFGHTTKPKYSAKLNLPKTKFVNVLVRASYSESFKAPDLGQTHQARTIASTTLSSDPLRPGDGARTVRVIQGGNPDLKPELGKVQYLGFVFEVPAVRGLSFTADYLDIKIRNTIGTLTVAYLLSPDGLAQHPDAITRGPNLAGDQPGWAGPITEYRSISENLGFTLSQTWDFGVRYSLRTEGYGSYGFNADVTQLVKRGSDSGLGAGFSNSTGRYNAPIWRGNYGLNWRYKNFSTAVTADVVGKFYNNGFAAGRWGENVFTVVNTSVTYRGFKGYNLSVGANNALNHRPPQNGYSSFGFDERGVDAGGANGIVLNLRARREF